MKDSAHAISASPTQNDRFPQPFRWLLVVPPVILVAVYLAVKWVTGPYYLSVNFDPDYAYLFNALDLAVGLASPALCRPLARGAAAGAGAFDAGAVRDRHLAADRDGGGAPGIDDGGDGDLAVAGAPIAGGRHDVVRAGGADGRRNTFLARGLPPGSEAIR